MFILSFHAKGIIILDAAECLGSLAWFVYIKQHRVILLFLAPTGAQGVKMLSVRPSVRSGYYSN